jgi:hypothetical protein
VIINSEEADGFSVELPRKIGVLKKYAVGGFMGVKTMKTRWFRLEGGELRYYASEDMRPIKLKGTVSLAGANLLDADPESCSIQLQIGKDSAGMLMMEATTAKIAREWHAAFEETLLALRVRGSSSHQKRRQNLADISAGKPTVGDRGSPSPITAAGAGVLGFDAPTMNSKSRTLIQGCMRQHFLLKTLKDVREPAVRVRVVRVRGYLFCASADKSPAPPRMAPD